LVRKFEKRLKDFLGVKNIITVANGTLALQLTYKAFGLKEKAITTPFIVRRVTFLLLTV